MNIEVIPATADRFDDLAAILSPKMNGKACWCLYYRLNSSDYRQVLDQERFDYVRDLMRETPPPGLLAYVEGEPAGWCGMGPRSSMGRLERSQTIPKIDDAPVWSIVCFTVRAGYRRQGLTHILLESAIAFAREYGAVGLEAYPIEVGEKRAPSYASYVGTTAMFTAAGFHTVTKTRSKSGHMPRWLMRLELNQTDA